MKPKTFLRRTLFFLMCLIVTSSVSALEVTIDGLVYELSGTSATVLYVAEGNQNTTIEIPATVEYEGLLYTVNKIGEKAFCNYYRMKWGPAASNPYSFYNCVEGYYHECSSYVPYYWDSENANGGAARHNSYVTKVVLPNTITIIPDGAFNNSNILSVEIQEGVVSIGKYAFYSTQLTCIQLPTTLRAIGSYAFASIHKLTKIIIPESVTSFNDYIFQNDDLLRTIIYTGVAPPTRWVATTQTYVPDEDAYKTPSYTMNSAQILPMIKWENNTFNYTGALPPNVEWTNNIEGYVATVNSMNPIELEINAGTWKTEYSVTFTKDGESFTANCVYNYTINQVPLVAKANDTSRTYGEDNPVFSCTYTGFVNNEDANVITTAPTMTTLATADSDVGTYSITASEGVAQNYSFTYEDGTLTVLPAHLSVTVNDATRVYGDENPAFALTYSGLKNDEVVPAWNIAPTFTTTATKTSDVGTYEVDVTAEPRNYTITSKQKGALTVTQAPLTLKVDDATRLYYADDPEFTFTCEGFKNDDDASVLTTQPIITPDAIKRSYVGTYDLNASDAEAKNYAITYEPGTLTITPRTLTVTPDAVTRPYGEPNPTFTCSYEGFVNNETERVLTEKPTVTTTANIGSNAGSYDLRVSGGKATNYTFTYQTSTLTIAPRELTVSVGDYERDYGEDNPTFVLLYDNFGAGDDENALTYKPTVRTTATKTSDVGTYPITISGGYSPNYNINYVQGSLIINRAEQTFTWEQDLEDLCVGDQVELKAIASSGLPVTFTMEDNDIVDVYQAGRKTYMECLKPGSVQITAVQEGNKNYYPTQRIRKTIVVNVATGVEVAETESFRIQGTSSGIRILNASVGETIRIFAVDGTLVKSAKTTKEETEVELPEGRIFIVKIADKVVKVKR